MLEDVVMTLLTLIVIETSGAFCELSLKVAAIELLFAVPTGGGLLVLCRVLSADI